MGLRTAWQALYRRLRRGEPDEDPRAEELRQKLEESRAIVEEQHEETASPELPVDAAPEPEPPRDEVEERRRAIHERARAATEEMRGDGSAE